MVKSARKSLDYTGRRKAGIHMPPAQVQDCSSEDFRKAWASL
jgi:hypothetical protein